MKDNEDLYEELDKAVERGEISEKEARAIYNSEKE